MRRALPWVVAAGGLVLVVAGVVVFVVAERAPVGDVGWFAYAPLEPGTSARDSTLGLGFDDGWTVLWTARHWLGAGLLVAGLLVLAALAGWLLGRRPRARARA